MKKHYFFLIFIFVFALASQPVMAGSCKLSYKLKPGQTWTGILSSQNEGGISDKKKKASGKTIVEYKVKKGAKKGWMILEARILSTGKKSMRSRLDLSKITYSADFHESGEIGNISYSGDLMPDLGPNADQIPQQTLDMMKQSFKALPEMWKHTVYWFPEVPEEKLSIGDEFDMKKKMGLNIPGSPMQMNAVLKQVFTLEDVSDGLAYFSVKERSVAKGSGAMGMDSKVQTVGKGDAVFDLEQGMWLEMTQKSKAKVGMPGAAAAGGAAHDMKIVLKYEMELQ